jgi:asparagine synthase (glutamine-hydrolysing)
VPGLTWIINAHNLDEIEQHLSSVLHTSSYTKEWVMREDNFSLACTRYPDYPIQRIELPDYTVVLEGRLYGADSGTIMHEMEQLSRLLFAKEVDDKEGVKNWLINTDGDFVIFCMCKKTRNVVMINDVFGRLPWYFARRGREVVLSREITFLVNLVGRDNTFDRMGIAQYLLFGYPLGQRTLFDKVECLSPSTIVRFDANTSDVSMQELCVFDFDQKSHDTKTLEDNAAALVSLFREACRHRSSRTGANVVSLSGGLDSRSVAAGLDDEGVAFIGATFESHGSSNSEDAKIAARLAEACGWDSCVYLLEPPGGEQVLRLLKLKSGLNQLGMSFILRFFEKIKDAYTGRLTYFTGDGGVVLKPEVRHARRYQCLKKLASHIIDTHCVFSLDTVADLTRLDKSEITREVANVVSAYPEQKLAQKFVRFRILERGRRFSTEGEDRNRAFFWSVSPFYCTRFFDYSIKCPDSQKERYLLYSRFLEVLSSRAADIADANVGLAPASRAYQRHRRKWIPRSIKKIFRKSSGYAPDSTIVKCLREQSDNCEVLSDYLSHDCVSKVVSSSQSYSKEALENLFTLTSLVEYQHSGISRIERYRDASFF